MCIIKVVMRVRKREKVLFFICLFILFHCYIFFFSFFFFLSLLCIVKAAFKRVSPDHDQQKKQTLYYCNDLISGHTYGLRSIFWCIMRPTEWSNVSYDIFFLRESKLIINHLSSMTRNRRWIYFVALTGLGTWSAGEAARTWLNGRSGRCAAADAAPAKHWRQFLCPRL